jgi:transcription initiation factor TFIIIB Brf1 subunit/transcription initiation factor TFIIB
MEIRQTELIDHNGGVMKCPSCGKHKREVERIEGMGKTWCYKCQMYIIQNAVDNGEEHPSVLDNFKKEHGLDGTRPKSKKHS